jgi:tripartite-type tricarboxylate transporter receptor subunit TctC
MMRTRTKAIGRIAVSIASMLLAFLPAMADENADFYRGKQLAVIVGYGPGGGYDLYGRLVARHIGRHIPGTPSVIVQNMPGAGSLRAANHIYNSAPRDGTAFGIFARNIPLMGLTGHNPAVQFDPRKFNWIGSSSSFADDAYLLFHRKDSKLISTGSGLSKQGPTLILGATGEGSPGYDVPNLLRDILKLDLRIIGGFPDGGSVNLAVDRGEVDGRMVDYSSILAGKADWLEKNGAMTVLLQFGRTTRHPAFPDAPTARELAPDPHARQIIELAEVPWLLSRCFTAPPAVPQPRISALRTAFAAAHRDPALLEDAARLKLEIHPGSAEDIVQQIELVANAPPEMLKQLKNLFDASKG